MAQKTTLPRHLVRTTTNRANLTTGNSSPLGLAFSSRFSVLEVGDEAEPDVESDEKGPDLPKTPRMDSLLRKKRRKTRKLLQQGQFGARFQLYCVFR